MSTHEIPRLREFLHILDEFFSERVMFRLRIE